MLNSCHLYRINKQAVHIEEKPTLIQINKCGVTFGKNPKQYDIRLSVGAEIKKKSRILTKKIRKLRAFLTVKRSTI